MALDLKALKDKPQLLKDCFGRTFGVSSVLKSLQAPRNSKHGVICTRIYGDTAELVDYHEGRFISKEEPFLLNQASLSTSAWVVDDGDPLLFFFLVSPLRKIRWK